MTSRRRFLGWIRLIAALVLSALSLVTGKHVVADTLDFTYDISNLTLSVTDPVSHTVFMPLAVKTDPPNQPPATPASPLPVDGGRAPQPLVDLSWVGADADGDAVIYRVHLEPEDPTPDQQIYIGSQPSCSSGALAPNTRYYWQVVAQDGRGATTVGPVWTFTTEASASDFAGEVVALTNVERATAGCPALTANVQLAQAALGHSLDMATNDYFSHTSLDGRTPWDRIRATDYDFSRAAENIAAGYATPASVVAGWMASDGHRANILNCALTEIGVGYAYQSPDTGIVNYTHYWTQVFATP